MGTQMVTGFKKKYRYRQRDCLWLSVSGLTTEAIEDFLIHISYGRSSTERPIEVRVLTPRTIDISMEEDSPSFMPSMTQEYRTYMESLDAALGRSLCSI